MSLEKWVEYSWLKAEPTSRDEIKSLLTIVNRDLKDANVAAISEDRRFEAAYSAARTAATIALRASGYRTSTQVGHHAKTMESLELTINADSKMIQKMRTFSKKRWSQLRTARRETELPEDLAGAGTADPAVRRETRERIKQAFFHLPAKYRLVATLALIEEEPYKNIGEAAGISVALVKVRVFRAVRMLEETQFQLSSLGVEVNAK